MPDPLSSAISNTPTRRLPLKVANKAKMPDIESSDSPQDLGRIQDTGDLDSIESLRHNFLLLRAFLKLEENRLKEFKQDHTSSVRDTSLRINEVRDALSRRLTETEMKLTERIIFLEKGKTTVSSCVRREEKPRSSGVIFWCLLIAIIGIIYFTEAWEMLHLSANIEWY